MSVNTCNSNRWTDTLEADLLDFQPQALGARHKPINHFQALTMFKDRVASSFDVRSERGMLSPDRSKYLYISTVGYGLNDANEYGVGFINFNDRTKAFSPILGERVFVCSNETITSDFNDELEGDENLKIKHKHSKNIDIREIIENIFITFKKFVGNCEIFNTHAKNIQLDEGDVGRLILRMHKDKYSPIGNTDILRVADEFFAPTYNEFKEQNLLNFYYAGTHIAKRYGNPIQKIGAIKSFRNICSTYGQQKMLSA